MMFFKNNNNAIIRRLAIKTMKANKLRNIFAVVAIALTTLLFTSLFTIGIGIKESLEKETMRQSGGYAHGTFKYLNEEELNKLKIHPLIKDFGYSIMLSMGENKEFLKHHTEVRYATDEEAEMYFCSPTTGEMPQKENEVVTSTRVLDLLGVPHEIGENIKIDYSVQGKKRSKELVLSGFYESDKASQFSMIWVSKAFIDKELAGIELNNKEFTSQDSGYIELHVMFENSFNIDRNLEKVLEDSGYSSEKGAQNYIATGVNWAYMSTNSNSGITLPILAVSVLIVLTGYLIIYNIFQISVIKDIRSFGLLKTIGTTPKQIKKIIRNQSFLLSSIGIPIGLVLGFIIGNMLMPLIMTTTNFKRAYVSFNPVIFIGAAFLSLITVYISCRKPGKIAASVSPVEAAKYAEVSMKNGKNIRKSIDGTKVYKMALYNIQRNMRKTIIVILSISLSLILLNSVYTFTNSFDIDKYVSKKVVSDFIVGHANYFNVGKRVQNKVDVVSESLIETVNNLDYIKDSGRVYFSREGRISYNNNERMTQIYGLDDFPMSQLRVVEGDINLPKLKDEKYIIESIDTDDNGNYKQESAPYAVGQKISLKLQNGKIKEYEIMAKVQMNSLMSVRNWVGDDNGLETRMILPANEFCKVIDEPLTMLYMYNVDRDNVKEAEKFIKNYTNNIEPEMSYESKQVYIEAFNRLKDMFSLVGGALLIVIGVIGILNFINVILTSIISRQREFAMLQSIGMTTKQLKNMLLFEGVLYSVTAILVSFILGSIISLGAVYAIVKEMWFCKYNFTILPLVISGPILLVFGAAIPLIAYRTANKKSVVERLREIE
ncbi:ABC transporter permease [Clostridium beijerinckii]|uniref:ABC transporter permease n=1 Tax=Clostridium beijerinckii TaxID=1520 RepID=UPI0022E73CE3|nr:ABC transporter permease [Clostridium beijerinckii]